MLVQDHIRKFGLESLNEFGIIINKHQDGRVILNYDQIESHSFKRNPIVRECRSLVLDSNKNWDVVSRSFNRFFNLNETEDDNRFDWNNYIVQHKEDGSLINLYYFNGAWHVNTRNSFGKSSVMGHDVTWEQLVFNLLPFGYWEWPKSCSYTFELCTLYNQVVVQYPKPKLVLLSIFDGENELPFYETTRFANINNCELVKTYDCDDVKHFVSVMSKDTVNEGVVIRDCNNIRLKIKNEKYLCLHRLNNNGNVSNLKNLLPLIISGEQDEVVAYFPFLEIKINKIMIILDNIKEDINNWWNSVKHLEDKKSLALSIKDFKFNWCIFEAKKTNTHPYDCLLSSNKLIDIVESELKNV